MNKIDALLKEYVYSSIVPQYSEFDKAHNIDHVNEVIENSLEIAMSYDIDIDMVFVIAAYHDVGIKFGRKNHNISSAKIMCEDKMLNNWFDKVQIEIMSEAIQDHRASNDCEPRTIYGKIVSEADRIIDVEKIIFRTMEYGKSHFPQLTDEEQFERTYQHIYDKYGENGYIKLWINIDRNVNGLTKIRELLKDKCTIRRICYKYTK